MKLIKKNNKKGFTLIELVIVIAILAVLALILVPTIGNYTKKANEANAKSSVRSLYTEAVLLHSEDNDATDIATQIQPDGQTDSVEVTISDDKTKVELVQYTYKGIVVTFDGKDLVTNP